MYAIIEYDGTLRLEFACADPGSYGRGWYESFDREETRWKTAFSCPQDPAVALGIKKPLLYWSDQWE